MSTIQKLTTWRGWLHGLLAAIIGGTASAGLSYLTLNGAHAAGADVPILNFKALGLILVSSGLVSAFAYLKQSPLPEEDDKPTPPFPVNLFVVGLLVVVVGGVMLGTSGCATLQHPGAVQPWQQTAADATESAIGIGLVPVLSHNPSYIQAAQSVGVALGTFSGDTLTPEEIHAFVAKVPLAEADAKTVEGVVNAAWAVYSKKWAQQVGANVRPDVKLFLGAVANGIETAVAAVPKSV